MYLDYTGILMTIHVVAGETAFDLLISPDSTVLMNLLGNALKFTASGSGSPSKSTSCNR